MVLKELQLKKQGLLLLNGSINNERFFYGYIKSNMLVIEMIKGNNISSKIKFLVNKILYGLMGGKYV